MIGQLAGTKAQITGVILAVDEGDAFRSEMLGELGDQHLVAALVIPVRLLDVGKQGVANDLSQGEPGDLPIHQQHTAQQVIGLVIVQHFMSLGDILMEGGRGFVYPAGIAVQKALDRWDILWSDGAEQPAAIGLEKFVYMVALATQLFPPKILQILRTVQIVKIVPLCGGGAGREKVLKALQLILGNRIKLDRHFPPAAVVGNLTVVFRPAAAQGQGKGGAQSRVVHFEIEGAVIDSPLGLVHIPPDKDGARGGVADTASAVSEKWAQSGEVFQLQGVEIQHRSKSLSIYFFLQYIR